ncbi:MAG: heme o synthase [Acidobacteria bacterium]|nr:heme o synthase [Acidobacteriota bacterium]MCI0717522.1 heme o synthase [Acidobacteriota bacterium]
MRVPAEIAQVDSASLVRGGVATGTVAATARKPQHAPNPAESLQEALQARPSKLSDYVSLTKPEVTFLVLIATALGGFMATESLELVLLCHAVFGTALVAGGTAALNHYWEREHDGKMRRTANRPLPSGRLKPREVLAFGAALSVAGILYLALQVNWLTSLLGLATLLSYLLIYTPLKRKTAWATSIGAFPGAAPVLMGWAAVRGSLSIEAWALYALLFVWQFPHFLAIAWMYREDYARAGMLMLPARDPRGDAAFRQILGYSAALIPVSLLPSLLGMTGSIYLWSVAVLGLGFFCFAWQVSRERSKFHAKMLLHATVVYLPVVYAIMVINKS